MPVRFFPQKPLELLEKFIQKEDGTPLQGEIDVYHKLFTDLSTSEYDWLIWHDFHLPFHSENFNPQKKASSQIDFIILRLSESNISDKANILKYTSMLKFKGLEKENVFLIISEPKEENKYEIYVGITRAISHLKILVVKGR